MSWIPADDPGILVAVTDADNFPSLFWQNSVGGTAADDAGELVKYIESGIILGPLWEANAGLDTRRATIGEDGAVQFGILAANGGNEAALRVDSSTAMLNDIHNLGYADLAVRFKLDSGYGAKTRPFIDNTNVNSTARGIYFGTQAGTGVAYLRFYLNNGTTQILNLQTDETIDDNAWHLARVHVEPGNGLSWIRVDNGTKYYGTLGTISAGNASTNLYLGNRLSLGTPLLGQLKGLRVGTSWDSDKEAAHLLDHPKGTITGSPEIRNSRLHFNTNKGEGYIAMRLWFDGQLLYPLPVQGDGTVYAHNGSSNWQGAVHLNETVTSKTVWVDGVQSTLTDGEIYSGSTVRVQRETEIGPAFYLTQTVTISGATKHEHVRMVRRDDGGTINSMYPIRNAAVPSFTAYLGLAEDGTTLVDSTLTTSSGIVVVYSSAPEEVAGVAQFSSSLGVMRLIVITRGRDLPGYQNVVIGESDNMRCYQELESFSSSEDDEFEMATVTKYYNTDSGSWKALAASELLKVLRPAGMAPINHRRRG